MPLPRLFHAEDGSCTSRPFPSGGTTPLGGPSIMPVSDATTSPKLFSSSDVALTGSGATITESGVTPTSRFPVRKPSVLTPNQPPAAQNSPSSMRLRSFSEHTRLHGSNSVASAAPTETLSIFSCSLPGDVFEGLVSEEEEEEASPSVRRFRVEQGSTTSQDYNRPMDCTSRSQNESSSPREINYRSTALPPPAWGYPLAPIHTHPSTVPNVDIVLESNREGSDLDEGNANGDEDGLSGILSFNPRPIQSSSSKTSSSNNSKYSTNCSEMQSGGVLIGRRSLPPVKRRGGGGGCQFPPNASSSIYSSSRGGAGGTTTSVSLHSSQQFALRTLHDSLSDHEEDDSGSATQASKMPIHHSLLDRSSLSTSQGGGSENHFCLPTVALPPQHINSAKLKGGRLSCDSEESARCTPASATLDPQADRPPMLVDDHYDPEDNKNEDLNQTFPTMSNDTNPRLHEFTRYGIDEIIPDLLYLCAARALRDMSKSNKLGITAFVNTADEVNEQLLGTNNNFFTSMVSNSGSLGHPCLGSIADRISSSVAMSSSVGHASSRTATSLKLSAMDSIYSSVMSPSGTSTALEDIGFSLVSPTTPPWQGGGDISSTSVEGFVSSRIVRRFEERDRAISPPSVSPPPPEVVSLGASSSGRIRLAPLSPPTSSCSDTIPQTLRKPTYTRSQWDVKGKVYLRLPMKDTTGEVLKYYIEENWNFIEMCRATGRKVVVFCKEGKSRSVALVTSYIMRRYGMGFSEALEYVRARRVAADPNIGFCMQLQRDECFDWGDGLPMDFYDGSNPDFLFQSQASTTMQPVEVEVEDDDETVRVGMQ